MVLAIGLDSGEPAALEAWMDEGHLPNMASLRESGAYGRLENLRTYSAETPWTTFASGCHPKTVGYWSPLHFEAENYAIETRAAYDFRKIPPFYALGDDYRVAAFDIPQVPMNPNVNGVQVGAWGAHSPQIPCSSQPPELYQELIDRFGEHPGLHKDYAVCTDHQSTLDLREKLRVGIERRTRIMQHLLESERWDLAMTVFGEAHAAGHNFWHVSQPDHPLYDELAPLCDGDPMRDVFVQIDQGIGQMIHSAPDDAVVMVFSAHGMGANTMDLPSGVFLPELMHRYAFDGKKGLMGVHTPESMPKSVAHLGRRGWEQHVWATKEERHAWKRWLRESLPTRFYKQLASWIDAPDETGLRSPFVMRQQGADGQQMEVMEVPWQPAQWYAPLWPKMKAFALPTFAEGYVRINVEGREPNGVVPPSEFNRVCEEITELIHGLRDARKGIPMVAELHQVRSDPHEGLDHLPPADIVVVWQDEFATDGVVSDRYGLIGPVPHYRAGSHRHEGFMSCMGPGIHAGSTLEGGHALDIAPTILNLMGAALPPHLEGKVLLERG